MTYLLALLIGVVAGLRAGTAPAAVSWAAYLGWLPGIENTWAWFMGHWLTPWIFTILAIAELIGDQLPSTPSRKTTQQFSARLISGALSGATLGAAAGLTIGCLGAGVIGAFLGTLGATRQGSGWSPRSADATCRSHCSRMQSRCWARC